MKYLAAVLALCVVLLLTGHTPAKREQPMPSSVKRGFLCIHRYEGSWRDPDAPYYGGLQMDWGFMETYGTWLLRHVGTADRWTPHQQMKVAYRAYRGWKGYEGRGYYPWPNTARYCGLI